MRYREAKGTFSRIVNATVLSESVTRKEILGESRAQHIVAARHMAMAVCRRSGLTVTMIGRLFGRDHSTVVHAVKSIEAHAQIDADLECDLHRISTGKSVLI